MNQQDRCETMQSIVVLHKERTSNKPQRTLCLHSVPCGYLLDFSLKVSLAVLILAVIYIQAGYAQVQQGKSLEYYIRHAPFQMPDIPEPHFPDRIFNITDYGAVGNGEVLNTQVIQHTIDLCARSGGGVVVIPPGLWLTGPIELQSNINLHLERGAILLFSPDHALYPIIKMPHSGSSYKVMSPIYGHDLANVAITGGGVVDGNGQSWRPVKKSKVTEGHWRQLLKSGGILSDRGRIWWPSKKAMNGQHYLDSLRAIRKKLDARDYLPVRTYMRPYLVSILFSKNVLLDGPTFENAPAFALFPKYCTNLIIRNVKVNNAYWAQNGDGIDVGDSKNVAIYRNTVTAGDDGICMKSSPIHYPGFSEPAMENVIIAGNIVHHAHGGFVIGSNTDGGIKNVWVTNCAFIGTDRGLRFKSRRGRGGLVHDIYVDHIAMSAIVDQAIYFNTYYELSGKENKSTIPKVNNETPRFQDIHISHVYCKGANTAVSITGLPEMPVKNIMLNDVRISSRHGFYSDEVSNIMLNNVTVRSETGVVYALNNSRDVRLNRVNVPPHSRVFMKLSGSKTSGVEILNTVIQNPGQTIEKGPQVSSGALKIEQ